MIKIKDRLKPLLVDRTARSLVIVSTAFSIIAWLLLAIRLSPLIARGQIAFLHYNIYLNVNNVGPAIYSLLPALIGTIILSVNIALATRLYGPSRQNALVILAITSFYELLVVVAAFFVVLINISR